MKIVGIIIESNPFHNGHKYLIEQVKKQLKPDILIALSSGYFTMRGEISILDKKTKTKLLLKEGFDVVIDYPLPLLLNSSDFFGSNAVEILSKAKITHLAFGIESENINNLIQINKLMKTVDFQNTFYNKLKSNNSYKKAFQQTLCELELFDSKTIDVLNQSNNTLALSYISALDSYPNINIFTVKRQGNDEENSTLTNFPSGTALRTNYLNNIDISQYLPYDSNLLTNFKNYDIKFKTILDSLLLNKPKFYSDFLHINEGIENYIFKNYDFNLSPNENINLLTNKTYSKSRIRRTLLSMILQIPKDIEYNNTIRILGFSKKGEKHLKNIDASLILNISKENDKLQDIELKASKLYDILTNNNTYEEEYRFPIKGENNE